ncbi:hypothetical protein DKX38_026317 [Salix brachista]|uniref:DUF4283 domain-containing protein n=1 Tax=Salix brachista TaxID=2182728 RepID=A0A5N5JRC9_9ROSI|nr:hypothetical protein DKX38_026317 [Salix brachista]
MTAIKPSSWAERVRVSDSNSRCTLEKIARQPPGTILQIPKDMQLADAEDWKRSMIGFFVSYKLPFYAVQSIANRIWKTHGLEKTMVLSNGFMVFRFSSVTQMEEVLARGPWMFGGKTILLQQWKPGFKFDRNKIKTIPVWARLQGLPFPLWNKQGLSMAASMVGRPLASDEATLNGTRVEYARVCIEIEADVPLVHHFQVASSFSEEPITVDVTYEWKPSRCEICQVFGHSCRPQTKEKGRDIETLETEDQKSEVKGKESDSHPVNSTVVSKELHQQKTNHEEGPRVDTMKENNGKVKPTSEGLTVGNKNGEHENNGKVQPTSEGPTMRNKTGEHASTETIPIQSKGNKAAAIVVSARDDLHGEPLICTMNKMVSVSSEIKGKGKEIACEITAINNVEDSANCRIFVGWNTRRVHVQCIHASDQWITCDIRKISNAHVTRITFVYGSNNYGDRISLWQYLGSESINNASIPWSILGDFNTVLRPNDRSGGSSTWQNHHNDFPNCIMGASLQQIPYSGIRFTWHNGQSGEGTIMRKLDWIFGNQSLLPHVICKDTWVWTHNSSGQCTIKSAWEQIRTAHEPCGSSWLIWHKWHIPRHSFVLWLATRSRLRTMDRLHTVLEDQQGCVLCNEHMENHNHLFFSCNYSTKVWGAISGRARISWPRIEWAPAWNLVVDQTRSENSARQRMVGIVIAASVYHLWQERNRRIYDHHYTGSERLIDEINFSIRGRLANLDRADELPESMLQIWRLEALVLRDAGSLKIAAGGFSFLGCGFFEDCGWSFSFGLFLLSQVAWAFAEEFAAGPLL